MTKAVLAIHGGAGCMRAESMSSKREIEFTEALHNIISAGQAILTKDGSALDAVTEAVRLLEDSPLFNAGYGAVLTHDGTHELDACIMDGRTLAAGAVTCVQHIRNPILAARQVMENSPYVMLTTHGAEKFALEQGLEWVDNSYFTTRERWKQLQYALKTGSPPLLDIDDETLVDFDTPLDPDKKFGTVGAVALDNRGNLAAATSTGGLTNKHAGRIGDTPIIGAGCYANNNTVAVSATGVGEIFIRCVAGHDISAMMEYGKMSLKQAAEKVVMEKISALGGEGGVISISSTGLIAMPFSTEGMYRGYGYVGSQPHVAIYKDI